MTDEDYEGLKELITGALQPEDEIAEEDLDNVSGGAWYKFKCSCGQKFATSYFANLHAAEKMQRKSFVATEASLFVHQTVRGTQ